MASNFGLTGWHRHKKPRKINKVFLSNSTKKRCGVQGGPYGMGNFFYLLRTIPLRIALRPKGWPMAGRENAVENYSVKERFFFTFQVDGRWSKDFHFFPPKSTRCCQTKPVCPVDLALFFTGKDRRGSVATLANRRDCC